MIKKLAALFVFLGLLSGEAHATCSAGVLPNNLTNGTLADASQVMANYNAIIASVNATCAGSGANADITSLSGLTTALTPSQGGTNTWVANTASGGSANAQTVTTSTPTTSFTLTKGYSVTFLPGFTNTSAATLAVNGTTATTICMRAGNGFCNVLTGNELNPNVWVTVTYDGTNYELVSNQFQPGWGMSFTMTGSGNLVSQSVAAPARSCEGPVYGNISVTVASNNLTVTLLNGAGSTPTAAAPVLVCFPNATGGQTWATATASTTFVANNGSTFGSVSNRLQRYWVVLFNNAGVVNIGIYNSVGGLSTTPVAATAITPINLIPAAVTTTACNACTNATSNATYYSTTTLANTTVRILGYFEVNEPTAGAWSVTPSPIVVWAPGMPKPGDVVQTRSNQSATSPVTTSMTLFSAADPVFQQGLCEGQNTAAGSLIACNYQLNGSAVSSTFQQLQPTASGSTMLTMTPQLYWPAVTGSNTYGTSIGNVTSTTFVIVTVQEIWAALEPANDNAAELRLAG